MEPMTSVDPREDPFFAVRMTIAVMIALIAAEPFGIATPGIPVALVYAMMSQQRGQFGARQLTSPLAIPIIVVIFSFLAAATVSSPAVFVVLFIMLATIGFVVLTLRGNQAGMMLLAIPSMLSIIVASSDVALASLRDLFVSSGLLAGIIVPAVTFFMPPRSDRVYAPKPQPTAFSRPVLQIAIRMAVFAPILIYAYASANPGLAIVPIMVGMISAHPTEDLRLREGWERIAATLAGAVAALACVLFYLLLPYLPVLVCLTGLVVLYYASQLMTGGVHSAATYQFAGMVALTSLLSSVGAQDTIEVLVPRVAMTALAAVIAISAVALLETLLVRPPG